jgi:DNA polymerase-1
VAKILLLDGNSLAYRAFHALPTDLATSSGQVTNAVFGFTSMLVNLLKDHRPDAMAVAFDRPEPTFRHGVVEDYKAGREKAPDVLAQQMGLIRRVLEALRIAQVDLAGYEADDVLATLATRAAEAGHDVVVVTGDRDAYQLVADPHVKVLYNRRGVSDYVLYDEAGVAERTGVPPRSYVAYAALVGDPSDNLPGVPGVGPKTAARLVGQFGDLDSLFAGLDRLSPKLRQALAQHEHQVRRNAQVIPLVRDLPLELDLDRLRLAGWDRDEAHQVFAFLEMRTLWDRLAESLGPDGSALANGAAPRGGPVAGGALEAPEPLRLAGEEAARALERLAGQPVCLEAAWAGQPGRSPLVGLALAAGQPPGQVLWVEGASLPDGRVAQALARLVGGSPVNAHRAKELMRQLLPLGVDVRSLDVDCAVAAYLLDPSEGHYLLEDLASRWCGLDLGPPAGTQGRLDLEGGADPAREAARRVLAVAALAPRLRHELEAQGMSRLYDEVERPLVRVLARMEVAGVGVDAGYLKELLSELTAEVDRLEAEIQRLAGEPFKVNSTPQLRRILYEKLGLSPQKRTKTGYSTDAASLERLRGTHPIVDALLRYREVEKLRSTYGEGLLAEIGPDSRIHASFNQTVARTGRLSSDRPNLHNIPVRSEEGRRFRRAFVPAPGTEFLVADYNQVELRVIAHLAEDPGLIEAFSSGRDVHTATAARIFGVDPAEVTLAQRSKAKMVSYGLAYGMEAYGLSQRLGIPVEEAALILAAYFEAFPRVRAYMERTVEEARAKGYTETLFGRRRHIPELASSNFRVRQAGERQAMNAGIQGLAADIFKVALARLDARLEAAGLRSRLVLQVHDEVLLEVPPEEKEAAAALTVEAMQGAAELRVPLAVELAFGRTWADAKAP